MKFDPAKFNHRGFDWSNASRLGELESVLYQGGSERENLLMHAASLQGARAALTFNRRKGQRPGVALDFGCGTGRILRFFGKKGWAMVGTEVTVEMLRATQRYGLPARSIVTLIDGVSIPVRDESLDMIWVCGVLKYSLFEPTAACRGTKRKPPTPEEVAASKGFVPVYREIAKEMYRALKPGAFVASYEMFVDAPPETFMRDFEQVGFVTETVRILRRYEGRLEKFCMWRRWHRFRPKNVVAVGLVLAAMRYWLDHPRRAPSDFRDYLFIWRKPMV